MRRAPHCCEGSAPGLALSGESEFGISETADPAKDERTTLKLITAQ